MNVEIGAKAAQFLGKEYINEIAVAVWAATPDQITQQYGLQRAGGP
jgi:hypothetical protein